MKDWQPSGRALWGMFWRSTVFLPFAVVLAIAWVARLVLPVAGIVFIVCGEWIHGAIAFAAWVPLVFLFRWKRLRRDPTEPKDWPNDQENI